MLASSLTISYFTLHEAIRNKLLIFTIIMLIALFGLTEFVGEMVITETSEMQSASLGYILRIFAFFIICLFVITSMVREFNDKGFELILSLPIQRWNYFLGKFLGFAAISFCISAVICLPLLLYSMPVQVLFWGVSLFCELLIMIAVSLLCLFTFSNITISFTVVTAFYILSRTITTIILISESPILETNSFSQTFIGYLLALIAVILPDLSIFTQNEWLIYGGAQISTIIPIIVQTMIYLPLIAAATLFDLYRKNL